MGNAQSNGGNDALRVAYIAWLPAQVGTSLPGMVTLLRIAPLTGTTLETVVGTAGEDPYAPVCAWIGGNHSNGLHYQDLSIHLPDFTGSDAQCQQYMNRLSWCAKATLGSESMRPLCQ